MTQSVNMLWPESAIKRDIPAGLALLSVSPKGGRTGSFLLSHEPPRLAFGDAGMAEAAANDEL